jgi:hypothetical protein
METVHKRLEMEGLDISSVINWNERSRRVRKPPPLSYWDEYVATDSWYVRELTADVPDDEWTAAVENEDWEMDSEDEDCEMHVCSEEDTCYSEIEMQESESEDEESVGDERAVGCVSSEEATDTDTDDDTDDGTDNDTDNDASTTEETC